MSINDDGDRRVKSRRKSDQLRTHYIPDVSEIHNPLKMRMFLGAVFAFFVSIVIFAPLWLFLLIVLWLMVDYFVMLGGTLNWLNQKVDVQFRGTGFLRRILATDARIIVSTTLIAVIILLADYFHIPKNAAGMCTGFVPFQWSDLPFSHTLYMVYSFNYYLHHDVSSEELRSITFDLSEVYIFVVLTRGLLIGSLIHVLHDLLVNQHLAGVKFTSYPPIMSWIYKLVIWTRK